MKKSIQLMVLGLALSCTVLAQAAKPVFLITPVTKAPSTIYTGQTVTTTYKVTNNTPYVLDRNGVVELPVGIAVAGGSCTTPFNLEPGASCTLTLQIVADKLEDNVRGGPKVCNTLDNPVYCSVPSSANALNIIKSNNPPPITVGDAYGGGVIYRIDSGTAYVLSLVDVASAIWGLLNNVATSANNTFDLSDNTYSALAGLSYPAAAACRGYDTGDGAGNWYLPARNEWPLVVADIAAINAKSAATGFTEFTGGSEYWSSTQVVSVSAFTRLFSSASASHEVSGFIKNFTLRVRCVRALTL